MVQVLDASHSIDQVVDEMRGFKGTAAHAKKLQELVLSMILGISNLCHAFHKQGLFLFNFIPKNHYLSIWPTLRNTYPQSWDGATKVRT